MSRNTAMSSRVNSPLVSPLAPKGYKVICISIYNADLERLDEKLCELKSRGYSKASRSALIRVALDQVDLNKVPRGI